MNYKEANEKLQGRCKNRRKMENNTYLERRDEGAIALRLHDTDIITFYPNGYTVVDTGGWRTVTTKDRLNKYLPHFRVYSEAGIWYWWNGTNRKAPFTEGDRIGPRGGLYTQSKSVKKQERLRLKVAKYAKAVAKALPLDSPSSGDCWYCAFHDEDGKSWGELAHDKSHLLDHMKDGYIVPSLVYNALKDRCGQYQIAAAFGQGGLPIDGWVREQVQRSVKRYILQQLGQAA